MCGSERDKPPRRDACRRAGKCDDYRVSLKRESVAFHQLDGALIHWNCLPGFEKILNVKAKGLTDICACFLTAVAPGVANP